MQPDEEVARVKAIQDNASRLGLTWDVTLATISTAEPLQGVLDGDSTPIGLVSTCGPAIAKDRVYVLTVPPAGNFMIGFLGPTGDDVGFGRIMAQVRRTSNQSIPSGSQENISWPSNFATNLGGFTLSASGLTVAVPVTGLYDIGLQTDLASGGGSRNFVNLTVSGQLLDFRNSFVSGEDIANVAAPGVPMIAGGTVVASIFQNSGSAINLSTAVLTISRRRDE